MKRIYTLLLCVILFLLSTSCGTDFYQGKRPTDYEETIWKSSDPDVWFEIGKRDDMGILPETKEKLSLRRVQLPFTFGLIMVILLNLVLKKKMKMELLKWHF